MFEQVSPNIALLHYKTILVAYEMDWFKPMDYTAKLDS